MYMALPLLLLAIAAAFVWGGLETGYLALFVAGALLAAIAAYVGVELIQSVVRERRAIREIRDGERRGKHLSHGGY